MNQPQDVNELLKGAFGKNRPPLFTLPEKKQKAPEQPSQRYIQELDAGVEAQKMFDPNFGSGLKTPPNQYDDEGTAPAMSTQGPWGQPPAQK